MIFETWTSFELLMTAFALFGAIMLIFIKMYLKKIAFFNKDLHAVLLQSQEAQLRSHLRMAIQSPIKIWRETEQPPKQAETEEAPKKKIKKAEPATETEEPVKVAPKTIQPCEPMSHKWVMDKEKQYYCEKCGQRFAK